MTMHDKYPYVGGELELFADALNWKSYWTSKIRNFLGGHVLEVGAGIGSNTKNLYGFANRWTALEPDPQLSELISHWIRASNIVSVNVLNGAISSLEGCCQYDAILYIDVLEHIADDYNEVIKAYEHLTPGGVIIILSPAYASLYSAFDKSIGHYRRYNKKTLSALKPCNSTIKFTGYLDSAGLLASAGNKLFLKSSMPTKNQIIFWDKILIPMSQTLDKLVDFRFGKSILAIWEKSC